jgi:hypothetical protein
MRELSPHTRTRLIKVNGKKVREHRVIMAHILGRPLTEEEQVHHIDGNPLNNDPANLQVTFSKPHMCLHKQIYPDGKVCANCGKPFIVNPRKRKRNKCCSPQCAQAMRVKGILRARRCVA